MNACTRPCSSARKGNAASTAKPAAMPPLHSTPKNARHGLPKPKRAQMLNVLNVATPATSRPPVNPARRHWPHRAGSVPRHQDTSAALAGAYPFLAEGGLGSDGVFVGQDLYSGGSFVYDPWVLYQRGLITAPNVVLAGIVGSGKSSLAKSLYTRSLPFGRRVYVPGDPKGEHTAVAEAVGGQAIVLGHGLRN